MRNGKIKDVKSIADLVPDPRNARKHNPRNVGMIETGMAEVGIGRSIVIDEKGTILAGNATVEAAGNAFSRDVAVRVPTNGPDFSATTNSRTLIGTGTGEAEDDDFDAEAEAAKIVEPVTKPGDLYVLGRHRLLCGDSTNPQHVAKPSLVISRGHYHLAARAVLVRGEGWLNCRLDWRQKAINPMGDCEYA